MRHTLRLVVATALVALGPFGIVSSPAAETLRPAAERFMQPQISETPDFQRHVMPLLGRQGCNGRSCHGSFQGRGGFRLSLFGYDMNFDHEALTKLKGDADELRVNLKAPRDSLILTKTIDAALHEGGQRLDPNTWEYRVFLKWIEKGCPGPKTEQRLSRLIVEPSEIVFTGPGKKVQLRATALWADGTSEDVTCLCRFRTNNEAVAEIDMHGLVTSMGPGDTHVVAFYDNGVTAVPVLMPLNERFGAKYPEVAASTQVDRLIVEKLRKLGVTPSEVCDDATFLRRASLDVAGVLPTPAEVEAFAADRSADKRSRKIDELLARPEYAAWWATKLCDLTGNNPRNVGDPTFRNQQSQQWYDWLRARLAENAPYDEIVAGLVLAKSRHSGQSYDDYTKEMVGYLRKEKPDDFTRHDDVPQYWARTNFRTPEDRVLGISYSFLGIRIQCAQCHKHPFDQWTQQDFQQFTKFFSRVSYGYDRDAREQATRMEDELGLKGKNGNEQRKLLAELASRGEPIPLREVFVAPAPRPRSVPQAKGKGGKTPPPAAADTARLLGGPTIDLTKTDDPREAVMQWLRSKDNPFFAKALVNRVWAHYFGRGIIEPADDLNLANPPSNGPLLDYLSQGFIEHGFDLKWLHREIVRSDAYQRSWRPNATNEQDHRNFSRMVPRRLPAEVAFDAVVQATASSKRLAEPTADVDKRAISNASTLGNINRYAVQVFGKPERVTTCDCERSGEPTLLQSVFLQNDREMLSMIDRGGWLAETARELKEPLPSIDAPRPAAKPDPKGKKPAAATVSDARRDALIREAYLRTLSREPKADELARAREHLAAAPTTTEGVRDVLWALLNTREFIVNH